MKGPTVTVEPGQRGAGRRLGEQTSINMTEEMTQLLRIMKANGGGSVGDILREAAEAGFPKLDGYRQAKREYDAGRRIGKAVATGGKTRERDGLLERNA